MNVYLSQGLKPSSSLALDLGVASKIPDEILEFLSLKWQIDPRVNIKLFTSDSGVWAVEDALLLRDARDPITLPPTAAKNWGKWSNVSKPHAHLLTTNALRFDCQWWESIACEPRLSSHPRAHIAEKDPPHTGLITLARRDYFTYTFAISNNYPLFYPSCTEEALVASAEVLANFGYISESERTQDQRCRLCGTLFPPTSLPLRYIPLTGSSDYCSTCCAESMTGVVDEHSDGALAEAAVLAAIRYLADKSGTIPYYNWRSHPIMEDSVIERDSHMLLRMCMPVTPIDLARKHPKGRSWMGWLQRAGLVGECWRPAFGTYSTASDGHPCRSLLEKSVDDWLSSHGIEHDIEPRYPYHPDLNPGKMRADWVLGDGTFIEAAGLLSNAGYAAKIDRKKRLAALFQIPLIVVTPADLGSLELLIPANG